MSTSDGGADQGAPRSGPKATYPTERSPKSRKRWFYFLVVLVVVISAAVAYIAFRKLGDPEVSGQATGYELLSPDRVAVQFTVNRDDPSQAVACVARARAKDGSEVGRREVVIPGSRETQVGARTIVSTSEPPVIGEIFGCSTSVPPYLKPAA
ncbi:DUF4307 domain-containing protein [Gordonia shandongensis]|uniref:DUF4307 domain-containing protein n=1 Tax=Gordonia shandongensis TaxID=376351 RepID=UPI0003F99EC2|nr:DUF4307 domain-containing protein [Gordonia shandongensis]